MAKQLQESTPTPLWYTLDTTKGAYTRHTPNGELWDEIFKVDGQIKAGGGQIQLIKCISHASEKGVEQTPFITAGNDLADHWAGEASNQHELPWTDPSIVQWLSLIHISEPTRPY